MRFRNPIFHIVFFLASLIVMMPPVFGDHFDNQTSEERPKKHSYTKYDKSQYISQSSETGRPYHYTQDGDVVERGGKRKKGKGKSKQKESEEAALAEVRPKKKLKPVHFNGPETPNRGTNVGQPTNPGMYGGQPMPGDYGGPQYPSQAPAQTPTDQSQAPGINVAP